MARPRGRFETALAVLALLSLGCAPGRYGPTPPGRWHRTASPSTKTSPCIGEVGRRLLARKLSPPGHRTTKKGAAEQLGDPMDGRGALKDG